jgi:hypothetical protein
MVSNPPVAPPPPPPIEPGAAPQYSPPPMAAPKKKTSPLMWILVGCGGLILLIVLIFAILAFWGYRKVKEFGGGSKNPAVVAARIVAAASPDIEVVESDDKAGTVTLRNKKTGEVITMNAEDVKKGRLKFTNEKGEEVTFEGQGSGDRGSLKVTSKEGEMTFGAGADAKVPSWVPQYPGATSSGAYSSQTKEGAGGTVGFETEDSAQEVIEFYRGKLQGDGFEVEVTTMEKGDTIAGGTLSGKAGSRTVVVLVSSDDNNKTQIGLTFEDKSK